MRNFVSHSLMSIPRLYQKIPYLYFIIVWFWIGTAGLINGSISGIPVLFFCLTFSYLMFREKKGQNLLAGIFTLCWSFLMLLAYLSDAVKIDNFYTFDTIAFLSVGGILVVLNFLMSVRLIIKALDPNFSKAQTSAA